MLAEREENRHGGVGSGGKNHSNRTNLTERNGNAVRSWDSETIPIQMCVRGWASQQPVEASTWVRMTAICREGELNHLTSSDQQPGVAAKTKVMHHPSSIYFILFFLIPSKNNNCNDGDRPHTALFKPKKIEAKKGVGWKVWESGCVTGRRGSSRGGMNPVPPTPPPFYKHMHTHPHLSLQQKKPPSCPTTLGPISAHPHQHRHTQALFIIYLVHSS